MKYRDFSVIFYNLQCDDMIVVTSDLFHSVRNVFVDIAFHLDVLDYQKEHKLDQNETRSHKVIKLLMLHHQVMSTFLMNGLNNAIFLHSLLFFRSY